MKDLGGVIDSAVKWIATQQAADGSFPGQASTKTNPFDAQAVHKNTFFTSLVMICLQGLSGARPIHDKAAEFLKGQQSAHGSWNYWDRNSSLATSYPFPDDLDDTVCALHALSVWKPDYADGAQLAKLAKLLIANETRAGGPYRTWLVRPDSYEQWGDIDVVVNANIGRFLDARGVKSEALNSYLADCTGNGRLSSRYYLGSLPALYSLSSWYRDEDLPALLLDQFKDLESKSAGELAMLLSSACYLDLPEGKLVQVYKRLMDARVDGYWPAGAFYKEVTIDSQLYYAGSAVLSTALAAEALQLYSKKIGHKPKSDIPVQRRPRIYDQARKSASAPLALKKAYLKNLKNIIDADTKFQITDMAGLTAECYGLQLSSHIRQHLNLASLNGWAAYTIYDDFLDGEATPDSLPIANYALRQMIAEFQIALPEQPFQDLLRQTLDVIDAANQWEVTRARSQIESSILKYTLPDYDDHSKLAERSLGHMLAAVGVLLASGRQIDSPEVGSIQKFFHHYLIARQLNDDAHDWQEDLAKGHISSVATLLLKDAGKIHRLDIATDIKELRLVFWRQTIHQVAKLIEDHIGQARIALEKSGPSKPQIYTAWLNNLSDAAHAAIESSAQADKFIAVYNT